MANSAWDWLRRYWLWLLLLGVSVVVFLVYLLPTGSKGALKIVQETEQKLKALKDQRTKELAEIDQAMATKIDELARIKNIKDTQERLKALAEFANKRKR